MAIERRKYPRYRPTHEMVAHLADETGTYRAQGRLLDLSVGGCSLLLPTSPRGGIALIAELALNGEGASDRFRCRMISRCALGEFWQVSLGFEELPANRQEQLAAQLASPLFCRNEQEVNVEQRLHWRTDQWAAYLTAQDLPVMPRAKAAFTALAAGDEQNVSVRQLADIANSDPFLCLCLLREAESRRSSRLGHETTTPLAAAMQLGIAGFRELLFNSPDTDETLAGLLACEARATLAGRLAANWSAARADISPDELVMASLLAEIGELMLWHFAPALPQAALDALAADLAPRSSQAQQAACGFKFKELTLKCCEIWHLPPIIVQLIRGTDTIRANIARVCVDTARHVLANRENPALPDDLVQAKRLIPNANIAWLVSWLPDLSEEQRAGLVAKTEALMRMPSAEAAGE